MTAPPALLRPRDCAPPRRLRLGAVALAVVAALLAGCSRTASPGPPPTTEAPPLVYVAVGASETVGVGATEPLLQAWPQVLFRSALPRSTVFTNLGVPGATVEHALRDQVPEALRLEPDLVTVWLNVNDLLGGVAPAVYERRLQELVGALRRGGEADVLVANTPPLERLPAYVACFPGAPPNGPPCLARGRRIPSPGEVVSAVDAYNAAIARVTAAEGAVLVDLHAAAVRARAEGTDAGLVGADGFHPSRAGHAAVAAAFAAAARRTGLLGRR